MLRDHGLGKLETPPDFPNATTLFRQFQHDPEADGMSHDLQYLSYLFNFSFVVDLRHYHYLSMGRPPGASPQDLYCSSFKSVESAVFGKTRHPQFGQDVKQGAELGKTRLEQIQPDEAGEPEPVGGVKVGQEKRDGDEQPRDDPDDPFDVKFFFHGVLL
jgi:hypothetical protein